MWKQISPYCIQYGRFLICKAFVGEEIVYTAWNGDERITTERGDGALVRCKQAVTENGNEQR